ncbi:MAG TPA: hypothetical protein VFD50_00985 [Thermoleophilia bacterium]|nr:hypothetical protein [Thermoleophilia bacterium]
MSRTYLVVLLFLAVVLIALVVLWWYARRVKTDLDHPGIVPGARGEVELRPESIEQLRRLSAEPILLKQSDEGVRVQIEHRPMMPLMAFVGQDVSAALGEAAVAVSERYGAVWVVLLSPGEDGQATVQRLA